MNLHFMQIKKNVGSLGEHRANGVLNRCRCAFECVCCGALRNILINVSNVPTQETCGCHSRAICRDAPRGEAAYDSYRGEALSQVVCVLHGSQDRVVELVGAFSASPRWMDILSHPGFHIPQSNMSKVLWVRLLIHYYLY